MTPTHQEYMSVMQEICSPEPQAFRWFVQAIEAALIWDHVVDGDPVDRTQAHGVFQCLTMEWILNDWFHKNRASLVPVISGCVSAWRCSKPGSPESYYAYTALPAAVCLLIRGQGGVDQYMPRIHEIIRREQFEDMRRDNAPFFIAALPRSRTAWLAAFLTHGDVTCHHEALRQCRQPMDLAHYLERTPTPIVGDADPSLPMVYPQIKDTLGHHKLVFITRDPAECRQSLLDVIDGLGLDKEPHKDAWIKVENAFNQMRRENPDAMTFSFSDLSKPEVMKQLTEYCTGQPFDEARFRQFDEMRITADPGKVIANQKIL